MTDLSKFFTNNEKANKSFKETFTVEQLQIAQGGADLFVNECEPKFDAEGNQTNKGRCYFGIGLIRGSVCKELAAKMLSGQPYGTLQISHIVNDGSDPKYPKNFDGLVLMEKPIAQNSVCTIKYQAQA